MPKKKNSSKAEKRLKRYRGSCPMNIRERIIRSKTQRMFLIHKDDVQVEEIPAESVGAESPVACKKCQFTILGSTGNCYEVKIQRLPHCTCPDHARGNLCKHILFVLLKVMQLDPDSPLIYQSAWLSIELDEMFATMEQRFSRVHGNAAVVANEKVQAAYNKMKNGEVVDDDDDKSVSKQRHVGSDDDCPICFDLLLDSSADTSSKIEFCRAQCGANFHKQCIAAWLGQHVNNPTCPMCRQPWDSEDPRKSEGYANLGDLQGQAKRRDVSTYHTGFEYKKRRRRY